MRIIFSSLFSVFFSFSAYSQDMITISKIIINGNKVTQNEIIIREITFQKDSTFTQSNFLKNLKKSKENLINLKLFNFVEITPIIDEGEADITINLTERWYLWPYPIFEVSERNFNS